MSVGWLILLAVFGFYIYNIASLWFPPTCSSETKCIQPLFNLDSVNTFDLYLFKALGGGGSKYVELDKTYFWSRVGFDVREAFSETVQVPLLPGTRKNGTMTVVAVLVPTNTPVLPKLPEKKFMSFISLTKYMPRRQVRGRYLLGEDEEEVEKKEQEEQKVTVGTKSEIVTHWKTQVKLRLVVESRNFSFGGLVKDIPWDLPTRDRYKQQFYADELHLFSHNVVELSTNTSKPDPDILLIYQPTSLGAFRILKQVEQSLQIIDQFGFSEVEKEQVLMLLSPDRIYRLALTYTITFLHTVLSFLAFKNDIGFWKGRQSYAGLSQTTVIGNSVCQLIIFLFLFDSPGTSWLVLGTVGITFLIDFWKVTKVLKVSFSFDCTSCRLFGRGKKDDLEKTTDSFDATGMFYLSLLLYPLVIGWSIYSLFNYQHRTWWSWFISSAANGVYAFGFLMMTPQIFVNYKLKSVAHMPWRAMTYKVFNTFIDDLFAFIIEMPTVHRLATLRDDVIFFIYVYQRWIYPVDKSRVNEFGYVYEEEKKDGKKEDENKNKETKEKLD